MGRCVYLAVLFCLSIPVNSLIAAPIQNPDTGHWYDVIENVNSWSVAEGAAVASGGHLVTINDAAEQSWLWQTFGEDYFWIGFFQDFDDPDYSEPRGGWVWSSGEPVTFTNWYPDEPNNAGLVEHWAIMNWRADSSLGPGRWNDVAVVRNDVEFGIVEFVPVPGTAWLLASALLVIAVLRRQTRT